jgi:hypothetical protein
MVSNIEENLSEKRTWPIAEIMHPQTDWQAVNYYQIQSKQILFLRTIHIRYATSQKLFVGTVV